MSTMQDRTVTLFTPAEREFVRRNLHCYFSTYPTIAEGFQLKTWRGGPDAGKPKLGPVAKGLIERGLMRLDRTGRLPLLHFTENGIAALHAMVSDRRLADPQTFGHIRRELGLDPPEPGIPAAD